MWPMALGNPDGPTACYHTYFEWSLRMKPENRLRASGCKRAAPRGQFHEFSIHALTARRRYVKVIQA